MVQQTSSPPRERLTRERVIEAALSVMDREGLDAVTMRRVGRELGVEAMSLYNHVRDKDDLLEGLTDTVMSELQIPPGTGVWADDLRGMSREWRRLLLAHPAASQLLVERHKPLEGVATYRAVEVALELMRGGGLTPRQAAQAFNAFGGYIIGFVLMEQGLMLGRDPQEHAKLHTAMAEAVAGLGLPNIVECFRYFAECSTDDQFEFGLDLLIGGLEAMIARTGPTP